MHGFFFGYRIVYQYQVWTFFLVYRVDGFDCNAGIMLMRLGYLDATMVSEYLLNHNSFVNRRVQPIPHKLHIIR